MTRAVRTLVLVLVLLPLLLQGAILPHTHAGAPHGLFNHEHDLTLLAITGTVASTDAAAPAVRVVLVVLATAVGTRLRPDATALRTADSRAPPLR